jgi:hypothetical protein
MEDTMSTSAVPIHASSPHKRTGSIADILNHQASSNKRPAIDIFKSEEPSTSSIYIVLETRTGDMDGTSVHSVYATLTDANNAVIAIGECGSFDIDSDDFEVENEDGCLGFTTPDGDGDVTFHVVKRDCRPPSGLAAREWKNKDRYAEREFKDGSEGSEGSDDGGF